MRYITYIALILINFILQTTLFHKIEIVDITPNTMVILIVSFAFMRGEIEGGFIGFVSGFLVDSFFGQFLGLNAFIGLVTGFLCGKIFNEFYKNSSVYINHSLIKFRKNFLFIITKNNPKEKPCHV